MSVLNPNDGNSQQPAGGTQQPTTPASGSESQPLPEIVKRLESQLVELTTMVKGVQKGTDKQIGQVRGDIKRILELKEQGMNESQIQRELFVDSLMQGQNPPVSQQPTGSGKPEPALDVEPVLKSLQFPENDPLLATLKIKYQGDPQGLLKAAAEARYAQLTSPNPSPATSLSQTGAIPQQNLQEEFNQKAKGLRGIDIVNLKMEYRKKGLDIN